jgi:hypothetical protein
LLGVWIVTIIDGITNSGGQSAHFQIGRLRPSRVALKSPFLCYVGFDLYRPYEQSEEVEGQNSVHEKYERNIAAMVVFWVVIAC